MEHQKQLRFRKDGVFKIVHITDTQEMPDLSPDTVRLIEGALDLEKPDLVVFTGDQIKGYSSAYRGKDGQANVKKAIKALLAPLEARGIPFAVTFGNHDKQCGISNRGQLKIYQESPLCIADDVETLPGGGTYFLPIQSVDGSKTAFGLYIIDSQGNAKGGGYEPVDPKQIAWYRTTRDNLARENGGQPVPALVFQHIPLPEYYDVLERAEKAGQGALRAFRTHKNEFVKLGAQQAVDGEFLLETPASPDINTGEFEAMAQQGDVLGIYCGHDHKNSFVRNYKGIDLGYTQGCGFNVYGPGVRRGVRVFTLHEDTPRQYETHVVTFERLYGKKVRKPLQDLFYAHAPTSMDSAMFVVRRLLLALLGAGLAAGIIALLITLL